jgi:IclR family transcriptional regulator, acetate operon repressor
MIRRERVTDYDASVMQKQSPDGDPLAPNYPMSSVNNALRLILLFRKQPSVRLMEAREYLGVAHSTAHRLLAMLAYHGFVRQDPDSRAYHAGPALVEVGLAVVETLDVRKQARPYLEGLAQRFGETAHLAVLEGRLVRYLDAVESDKTLRVTARTGALLPAHCTSLGKALLAELDETALARIYPPDTELERITEHSIATVDELRHELAQVRRRGYAVNSSESEEGVGSVAMAFRDLSNRWAAIAIAAPVSRLSHKRTEEVVDALRESMTCISSPPSRS